MVKQTYSEKLRDPRWQKKRLEILQRDNFTCTCCKDHKETLHIHHKQYIRGREPWEYEDDNFTTLCKHCHSLIENYKSKNWHILKCTRAVFEVDYVWFRIIVDAEYAGLICIDICWDGNDYTIEKEIFRSELFIISQLFEEAEKELR